MAQLLTSLETETELRAIGRNNILFDRKCTNFDRQRDEIARAIQNLGLCNSHVKRMATITKEKVQNVMTDVEKHHSEIQKFVEIANSQLNSSFEKVDSIRSNNLSLNCGASSLSITLPFDSCIEQMEKEESKLRSDMAEIGRMDEILKTEKESHEKVQHSTAKAKGKAEKEMASLKEELQVQNGIVSALENSSSDNRKQLIGAKEEVSLATAEKLKLDDEVKSAEQIHENLLKEVEEANKNSKKEHLALLDKLHSDLKSDSEIDVSSFNNLPDLEDILQNFVELQQLKTEVLNLSQSSFSESETVRAMETNLENVKKQTKTVLKNIEQMKDYSNKLVINTELLTRKKSGMEAVKKQIAENTTVLGGLKVTENAVKPNDSDTRSSKKEEVFRRLEATRNDVPGPEPYQPYKTPTNQKVSKVLVVPKTTSRVSTNKHAPQYPGIKLLHPKKVASVRPNSPKEDSLFEDSLLFSDDSGTTLDAAEIDQVFSPIRNNDGPDSPPVVEFSMAAHMNEFSQRQAKIKASQTISKQVSEQSDDLSLSAIESDDDDEDDENDEPEDDDVDDLLAPDDGDLNQSAWGSDD